MNPYLDPMTRLQSIDPATGNTVWEGDAASPAEVQAAVDRARTAFPDWADRPRQDRIAAVKRYQAVLKARAPEMAEGISRETGKALWETTAELGAMQGKVDISIRAYDERTGERTADTAFGRAVLRHRPHGVAAVLGPFNFPGHLPNGHIVPALLAGDTVVFKPSEETPLVGQLMAEAFEAAELPASSRAAPVSRPPCTTLTTPDGRSAASKASAMSWPVRGVSSDGLKTTVSPGRTFSASAVSREMVAVSPSTWARWRTARKAETLSVEISAGSSASTSSATCTVSRRASRTVRMLSRPQATVGPASKMSTRPFGRKPSLSSSAMAGTPRGCTLPITARAGSGSRSI